jgi:ankyrin repeat protein
MPLDRLVCMNTQQNKPSATRLRNVMPILAAALIASQMPVMGAPSEGDTETIRLMQAAEVGDGKRVLKWLDNLPIDTRDNAGNTPLLHALRFNPGMADQSRLTPKMKALAHTLIARGADVNISNQRGKTALIYAVEAGDLELVNDLLVHGARVNPIKADDSDTASSPAFTPLYYAVAKGNAAIAKALIAANADVNAPLPDSQTLLMAAGLNDKSGEITVILLDAGARATGQGKIAQTSVSESARYASVDTVKRLIALGGLLEPKGKSGSRAMYLAIDGGNSEVVKFLIDQGVPLNEDKTPASSTYLLSAIKLKKIAIAKQLLDAGANPNCATEETTPLAEAALAGDVATCKLLIEKGAEVNGKVASVKFKPPLTQAVLSISNNVELVKLLLDAGADPNIGDLTTDKNALDYAVQLRRKNNDEVIAMLKAHAAVRATPILEAHRSIAREAGDAAAVGALVITAPLWGVPLTYLWHNQ